MDKTNVNLYEKLKKQVLNLQKDFLIMQESLPIYFPQSVSQGFFKSKNSKFEAFLFPCKDIQSIDNELRKLQKKFFDATHICYAWRLGFENPTYRANDDEEPTYSAGMPIYRKIVSYQISDVLIAVVRYFGGTKLGVAGLIEAYETAAEIAIQNTHLQKFIPKITIQLSTHLNKVHLLYNLLNTTENTILNENYSEKEAVLTVEIPKSDLERLIPQAYEWEIKFIN